MPFEYKNEYHMSRTSLYSTRKPGSAPVPEFLFLSLNIINYFLGHPLKNSFFSHYKKVLSSSTDQFKADFGCYPPKPLNCVNLKTTFTIIYISRLGWAIYQIEMVLRLLSVDESRRSGAFKYNSAIDYLVQFPNSVKLACYAKLTEFKSYNIFERIKWIIFCLTFIPVAAVVVLLSVPIFILKTLKTSIDFVKLKKGCLGQFISVIKNEYEIVIMNKIDSNLMESVKSHEHLHLVQYVSRLNNGFEKIEKKSLNSPHDYLSEIDSIDSHVVYLFEINEVEARLHEVTLSYYRHCGRLPITVDAFFEMLVDSHELNEFFRDIVIFGENFPLLDKYGFGRNFYFLRDNQPLKGLMYLILCLKDHELRVRFITEVLPVMYSKLLGYYGDFQREAEFLAQVERPNLYDRFYGK